MLTKASFEAAVGRAALISHKKNGNKWDALMHLLSKEGLRGYGAVASDFHNLRLRAAQLMAERWFPGFDKRAHPDTGLFVLKGDVASRDASDANFLHATVIAALGSARHRTGSTLQSVIVLRCDHNRFVPRVLLQPPSASPTVLASLYPNVPRATME